VTRSFTVCMCHNILFAAYYRRSQSSKMSLKVFEKANYVLSLVEYMAQLESNQCTKVVE
ncbi:LSU ribosomal protein L2P, partial [Giardia duodenalis]